MAKSTVKTLRLNPKTEKELCDFVNTKGGVKKALKWLHDQYKLNQNIDAIVGRLKEDLKFMSTPTQIKVKDEEFNNTKADDLIGNFLS